MIKAGSFTLNTGTGLQTVSVSGISGSPKAILFRVINKTADGAAAGEMVTTGMATSASAQGAIGIIATDGVIPTDADRHMTNASCLSMINTSQTVIMAAALVSFNPGSFTINITTSDAVAYIVNYLLFYGSDVSGAKMVSWTSATATGNQSVTGVGFKPDLLISMSQISSAAPPTATTAGIYNFGFATSAYNQGVMSYNDGNAGTPSTIMEKGQQTNAHIYNSNGGAVFFKASLVSMDRDGWTQNWTTANGTARYIWTLAIKGGSFYVGSFNQATSLGVQGVTGIPFKAYGALLASFNNVTASGIVEDVGNSIGAADGSAQWHTFVGSQDNVALSNISQDLDRTKVIKMMTESSGTPTTQAAASWLPVAGQMGLDWQTVDATAREIIYIAFGRRARPI